MHGLSRTTTRGSRQGIRYVRNRVCFARSQSAASDGVAKYSIGERVVLIHGGKHTARQQKRGALTTTKADNATLATRTFRKRKVHALACMGHALA